MGPLIRRLLKTIVFFVFLELILRCGGIVFTICQNIVNEIKFNDKNATRVMCVGDSVTIFGNYPQKLEEFLNTRQSSQRFIVFNKGIMSATTPRIASIIPQLVFEYRPHIIVLMVGVDDTAKTDTFPAPAIELKESSKNTPRAGFIQRIFLSDIDLFKKRIVLLDVGKDVYSKAKKACRETFINKFMRSVRYMQASIGRQDARVWNKLGLHLIDAKDFKEADQAFKKMVGCSNFKDNVQYIIELFFANHRYSECEYWIDYRLTHEAFEEISTSVAQKMAFCYSQIGRLQSAEELLKKLVAIHPDYDLYFVLTKILRANKKYSEEKEILQNLVSKKPNYTVLAEAYRQLIEINELQGDYAQADILKNRLKVILKTEDPYYQGIQNFLTRHNVKLVACQYPMMDIAFLKNKFIPDKTTIFIDNRQIFIDAGVQKNYYDFFFDTITGDFGHFTHKGAMLMADNISKAILNSTPKDNP